MVKVSYSSTFKKSFKKKIEGKAYLSDRFLQRLEIFTNNPFDPSLKTHKLKGGLSHLCSFSIEYDLRVIFYFIKKDEVMFENIGTHDEVY
jgi:mRNA-degrading endonuclease YafQ of YafQ-DinJ toxin-antitoxin module